MVEVVIKHVVIQEIVMVEEEILEIVVVEEVILERDQGETIKVATIDAVTPEAEDDHLSNVHKKIVFRLVRGRSFKYCIDVVLCLSSLYLNPFLSPSLYSLPYDTCNDASNFCLSLATIKTHRGNFTGNIRNIYVCMSYQIGLLGAGIGSKKCLACPAKFRTK